MKRSSGTLYVVGTPIGNLEDITYRAVKTLQECSLILAENGTNSKKLALSLKIETPIKQLYASTKEEDLDWLWKIFEEGKDVSYISDAGTPGVSDPGANLVRYCRKRDIPVSPIPGPSSLTALLSVSGWQTNPAYFLGFLPDKNSQKKNLLQKFVSEECLIVVFESVHRIQNLMELLREVYPEAEILVGRELTKSYEEITLISPGEAIPKLTAKGEFAVIVNNRLKKIAKERKTEADI